MEVELGNLRTGFRWSSERGELEVAMALTGRATLAEIDRAVIWQD